MKVLITTDNYYIKTNGVVTSVNNLYSELTRRGHEVKILTFSKDVHKHIEGDVYYMRSLPLEFIYPGVRSPYSVSPETVREITNWKPDIIHSQCEFFSYMFALKIAKRTKCPIVHTYHTLYEDYLTYLFPEKNFSARFLRMFMRRRLRKATLVIAPTAKVKQILEGYRLPSEIVIVPTGINLDQHKKRISPEEREALRSSYGFNEDNIVLMNLGRLGNEKNLDEVIKYFAKASREISRLRLMIVGGGPAREGLEALASSLGVKDKVVFTGMVKPEDVQKYYQSGDVFVSASTSETQGLTFIEASANGLPLLCRKDGVLEDIIKHGENGYMYETEEEYMSHIYKICSDSKWIKEAGRWSALRAATFDKNHFGDKIETIYQEAIRRVKN